MNKEQANEVLMKLWLEKADDAVASAKLELAEGHLSFSVNRLYYCCFYVVTALLLKDGKQFAKHSALCQNLTKIMSKPARLMLNGANFIKNFLMTGKKEITFQPLLLNIQKL